MIAYSRAYTNSTSTKREGKTKTAESQMNERGRGLKPTSDEFMESVLETRKEMIVHNDLCNLLAWPSRKIVSKLGCCHIVFWTRWATHRTALGRELFQQCCKKQNHHQPSARSQRLSLHLHVPEEYTLTESNSKTDSHSSTSGEEELDDSENEDECQRKLY